MQFTTRYTSHGRQHICRKDLLGVLKSLKNLAFKSGSEPLEPAVEHVQPLNKSEDVERAWAYAPRKEREDLTRWLRAYCAPGDGQVLKSAWDASAEHAHYTHAHIHTCKHAHGPIHVRIHASSCFLCVHVNIKQPVSNFLKEEPTRALYVQTI